MATTTTMRRARALETSLERGGDDGGLASLADALPVAVVLRRLITSPQRGEVVALMPYLVEADGRCMSYMHVGQHSLADYGLVVAESGPADPEAEDSRALLAELRGYGYVPALARRVHRDRRDAALVAARARYRRVLAGG